jgi:hypothetical protein
MLRRVDYRSTVPDQPLDRLDAAIVRLHAETHSRPLAGTTHEDADDTTGTVATDDAIGFDPRPLLRALHEHDATAVVIGQVAGILHGSVELTGDLDLLWSGDPTCATEIAAAFASIGATITDDNGAPLPCAAASFAQRPKVHFRTAHASGDCCTTALPWGDIAVDTFLKRAETATGSDGVVVHYLTRDDLIAMRTAVGRPKDLRRAAELIKLGRS